MPESPSSPVDRLRGALSRLGLTQTAAAERIGIKQPTLNAFLSGKRSPSLDWLHAAAVALSIDPAELDERLASTRGRRR
jgi:transcriptional regulator with XRE-family HTH domain